MSILLTRCECITYLSELLRAHVVRVDDEAWGVVVEQLTQLVEVLSFSFFVYHSSSIWGVFNILGISFQISQKKQKKTPTAKISNSSYTVEDFRRFFAMGSFFWLCRMRDLRIKPTHHLVKTFNQMKIYFPSVDEPFWTTDFGMPFDPRRHGRRR